MSLLIQKQTKLISKPDLIYKDFFKKVENFMDLMNAMLFQGRALIDENSLVLCDVNGKIKITKKVGLTITTYGNDKLPAGYLFW